ncbi:hypothetical protein [Fulvivirga sp.]
MKSKLLIAFAIIAFFGLTSCSEEEISPNDGLNQTTETVSNGVTKDDKGF